MKAAVLYGASFRRSVIEMKRYSVDTISGFITIYGFFLILFFGAKALGGRSPDFGNTLSGLVVSYALWSLVTFSLSSLTFELVQEAQLGTLEQLGMSPFGLVRVLFARVITQLGINFAVMSLLLVLMMATTGRWLSIAPASTLPILALTILGVEGIGFVLGGVAIVFKRVQQALQAWQIVVLGLIAAPVNRIPLTKYLPLTWGATLLRRVMVDGVSLTSMPAGDVLFLLVSNVFYFALGVLIFKRFEAVARERGLLGHY